MRRVQIAGRTLGDGCEPFIVAEAGINHNGHLDTAVDMINVAAAAGCDAVKFSVFKAEEFCNPTHTITYRYQEQTITEPELVMFKRCELPEGALPVLKREAERLGIVFFATPQNVTDFAQLVEVGVPCVKVGSDDLTNLALIRTVASAGVPVILSTGMADEGDVDRAFGTVHVCGADAIVCACTSEYPCPPEHANVGRVATLRNLLPDFVPVGYSDHTVGPAASAAATALGAAYLEKHFTLCNAAFGPDHEFSAGPMALAEWVRSIRNTHRIVGHGRIEPTAKERENRVNWRRISGQQIRGKAA